MPGAGPTVTRESALNTLLTGEVQSSVLGGTPPGTPLIELDEGPPPDTLVVLPPEGESENDRYPIAVTPWPARCAHVRLDADRRPRLARRRRARRARGRRGRRPGRDARAPRAADRAERPLAAAADVLVGGLAYLAAVFAPRLAPRVFLLALAANLWLAAGGSSRSSASRRRCSRSASRAPPSSPAYLLVLGLDPEAVALSPFGPSQAGRFYGVSNLLETMLLVPALLGAVAPRPARDRGGALAVVAVAGNRFGADGGGLLVLLAGYATLLARAAGRGSTRPRRRRGRGVVVAVALALVGLDAALGGSSHVTEALGDGPGRLGDLADRLELSVRRSFAAFGPAFAVLASSRRARRRRDTAPATPVTDALLVALLVSLVVNDTPGTSPGSAPQPPSRSAASRRLTLAPRRLPL